MALVRTIWISLPVIGMLLGCGSGLHTLPPSSGASVIEGTAILGISDGVSASQSNVGTILTGSTTSKTLTLTNSGTGAATNLSQTSLLSSSSFSFLGGSYPGTGGNCTNTLNTGASCTLVVSFSPLLTGSHSNAVQLRFNDGSTTQTLTYNILGSSVGGGIDTSFGTQGFDVKAIGSSDTTTEATSLDIDGAGRILVGGTTSNGSDDDITLIRYLSDGSIDTSFGTNGIVTLDNGGNEDRGPDVEFLSNGKILLGGRTLSGTFSLLFARYHSDGSLDTTFSSDGLTSFTIGGSSYVIDLTVQSDGRIVATGHANGSIGVTRLLTSGARDTTFSSDGILTVNPSVGVEAGEAVFVQTDGRILVGGGDAVGHTIYLVRFNTNGSLDTTFDSDGLQDLDITTHVAETIKALAIQSDGKIISAGEGITASAYDFFAMRINTDGSLDTSFGTAGLFLRDFSAESDRLTGLTLDSSGKIILSGYASINGTTELALLRLNSDGSVDTTFGTNGAITRSVSGNGDVLNDVALNSSGNLLMAGKAPDGSGNGEFAIGSFFP